MSSASCKQYEEHPFEFVNLMKINMDRYTTYLNPPDEGNGNIHLINIPLLAGRSYKLHLLLLLAAGHLEQSALPRFKRIVESAVYYSVINRIPTNQTERAFIGWCSGIRKLRTQDELEKFVAESMLPVILDCSVCAEAALVNEYRQVCNACGIEEHQQRNYQGDTGKKFSPKRKRCGLEIYRRFLYCGQGSRFRDFRFSGDFAAAAADDVAYRYPLGNQVASHAVGRRCVEAVAGEELTGCSLCHNAAIKEQTAFVGILRTERDIVAYHQNGYALCCQPPQNQCKGHLKLRIKALGSQFSGPALFGTVRTAECLDSGSHRRTSREVSDRISSAATVWICRSRKGRRGSQIRPAEPQRIYSEAPSSRPPGM